MKKLIAGLLALIMVFACADPAQAVVKQKFTYDMIVNKDIDVTKVYEVLGSDKDKEITIEAKLIKYMAEKNIKLRVKFSNSKQIITLDGKAFINEQFNNYVATGESITVKLKILTDASANVHNYFAKPIMNAAGLYCDEETAFRIKAEILSNSAYKYSYSSFGASLNMAAPYVWLSRSGNDIMPTTWDASMLRYYSVDDYDRPDNGERYSWSFEGGTVDTANGLITFSFDKPGFYCALAAKNHSAASTPTEESKPQQTDSYTGFADMKGHWAESEVAYLQSYRIITESGGKFEPQVNITRAQYTVWLTRLLKLSQDLSAADKFTDISVDTPNYNELVTAASAGLITGYGNGLFAPDAKITREEMAALITRALVIKNKEQNSDIVKLENMGDSSQISVWAKNASAVCVNAGLITGKDNNRFSPKDFTTRAEATAILARLDRYLKN
ncbi:MAG: S-layer homology domain-containing protein [Clostridia bacterium]|nr:S-layer homology domain-containing protein [Clostridia bacterium]